MIPFLTRNIYEGYQLIDSLEISVSSKPHSTFLEKFETTSDLSREFLCTAILTKEVALRCFFISEKYPYSNFSSQNLSMKPNSFK